jgi:pyroglutamyl-peptidase
MKILLSGFETFGDNSFNPSKELMEFLPERLEKDLYLEKLILPVDHLIAPDLILKAIRDSNPDGIIAFGLAAGRPRISLERVAINLMDFRIPDNSGAIISDKPINPDGPAAYFTTLPLRSMLLALIETNIPAEISLSAGSYLCNQVFYTIMHEINTNHLHIPAGFVHLPASPEAVALGQQPMPSMDMGLILQAAKILIRSLASC